MGVQTIYTCDSCGKEAKDVGPMYPQGWRVVPRFGDTKVYCPTCKEDYLKNSPCAGNNRYG